MGGVTHVIASLLAGAETAADRDATPDVSDFKREVQRGAKQAERIEQWARKVGCWTERVEDALPRMLGEQIAEGGEAIVYDHGATLVKAIGLDYSRNWTFATPEIYLSDLHDENVIRSKEGNIFVVDCDMRINTPSLRCGMVRNITTEVEIF